MIQIQTNDFDVGLEHKKMSSTSNGIGAVCSFVGLVRDFSAAKENIKENISAMTLEHYPGMTEKQLKKIEDEALERWDITDILIIHRIGKLTPGDQIVLVMVSAPHRDAAFDGARFIMDFLKTEAPFWKKEQTNSGTDWVDAKTADTQSAKQWEKK